MRKRLFSLLVGLLLCSPLLAREQILAYDSEVDIRADGSLDVVEHIRVRAEGHNIRRGIYRDFPTRYRDRYGNRVVVDFEMIDVQRDGRPEPWFTERRSNGVRINTGNGLLPVPADFTLTLRYRTTRQLGFFAAHDELYWNAIGHGWDFDIASGSVEVRLPEAVATARMRAEGYTGPQGARGQDYRVELPAPGIARWRLTRPLPPREGLTIVLAFPKGVVAEPTRAQRIEWLLEDNRGVLIALAGLVLLLLYCVRRWHKVGRDPKPGTIIVRYEPPKGYSPAGLRYMRRRRYDSRCFSADLLATAVDGDLLIHRDDGVLRSGWRLERLAEAANTDASAEQRKLLDSLLPRAGSELELRKSNASRIQGALQKHAQALKARFQPNLFTHNSGSIALAALIAAVSIGLAVAIGVGTGSAVLLVIPIGLVMGAVLVVFAIAVAAPTPAGRKLLDEIEGLRAYLTVAEKQDLERLEAPGAAEPRLDANRFERLLPYAVALGVEDAWTKKFTLAVGAAAAAATTDAITWYRGDRSDLRGLTNAIGSSLSSQIASSASPPGSSSGGGGGGSSGGGGGGGGGGGR